MERGWGHSGPKGILERTVVLEGCKEAALPSEETGVLGWLGHHLEAKTPPSAPWAGPPGAIKWGLAMVAACWLDLEFTGSCFFFPEVRVPPVHIQ